MKKQNNIGLQELSLFSNNPFKYFLEAFIIPFKKGYLIYAYELLVLSAIMFWLPFGSILVDTLIASCAVIFFRKYIFKTEDVSIFEYFLKMLPFVITATGLNFLFQIYLFFEQMGTNRSIIHWLMIYLSLKEINFSAIFVKLLLLKVLFVFLFSGFFIVFSTKKNPYFMAIDIKKVYTIFYKRFIAILLATLPYIIISVILIYTMNVLHVFYKPKDSAVYIALLFSVINTYLLLVTSVLWAKMYLVKIQGQVDFSERTKVINKTITTEKFQKITIVLMLSLILTMGIYIWGKNIYNEIMGIGKWYACSKPLTERFRASACPLNDGTVLISGGVDKHFNDINSAEIYDPKTDSYFKVGDLNFTCGTPRSCIKLPNGNVYIGGRKPEIYNYKTKKFEDIVNTDGYIGSNFYLLSNGDIVSRSDVKFAKFDYKTNKWDIVDLSVPNDVKGHMVYSSCLQIGDDIFTSYPVKNLEGFNPIIQMYNSFTYLGNQNKIISGPFKGIEATAVIFLDRENILYFSYGRKNNKNKDQFLIVKEYNTKTKKTTNVKNKLPKNLKIDCVYDPLYKHLDNGDILFVKREHPISYLYKRKTKELILGAGMPESVYRYTERKNILYLDNGDIYVQNGAGKNLIYRYKK